LTRLAGALVTFALFAGGCAVTASEAPHDPPIYPIGDVQPVSPEVARAKATDLPGLARDSANRQARRLTVRVRNISCEGISTGSGFAIARDVLVTNRHVVAGALLLQISTWDGRSYEVSTAAVGRLGDLGIAVVEGRLPRVGEFGRRPHSDDLVTAVGYPLGGPLRLSRGLVVDRVDGGAFDVPGSVVRITARVRPGNSGGPLLNESGQVTGVVYAIERSTGLGLAIPVDTVRRLARIGGFEGVPACGSE
jgi:S1-C subfamily serine protease